MEEIWKRHVKYGINTDYIEVSNWGNVRSRNGTALKLCDNGAGYLTVCLGGENKKAVRDYIHRVVANTFIDNPLSLPQVNHKDCDKSNNRVDNLEWCTRSDNILDAHAKGRMVKRTTEAAINVLTEQQVVELYTAVKRDGVGVSEQARRMNIPRTTASSILNKRSRKDITDPLDVEFANGTT